MEKKPLALVLMMLIAILTAFTFSYLDPTTTVFGEVPLTITVLAFFLAGTIYFGYFAFIPGILFGLDLGATKNAAIFLYIFPLIIATYAGTLFGFVTEEDFKKKKNLTTELKTTVILLVISIILALIIEMGIPMLTEMWPKDFFGMNLIEGKTIGGMIGDVSKLIRH
jgi:hypothetical protein